VEQLTDNCCCKNPAHLIISGLSLLSELVITIMQQQHHQHTPQHLHTQVFKNTFNLRLTSNLKPAACGNHNKMVKIYTKQVPLKV